jgi:selenide,water dikinase
LGDIPLNPDPRVLIDFRHSDDAGVYAWEGGPALVQTVDFFTPIVDDPYVYGQIAAANSLSDVYAMGGRPLTALAIAGFPKDALDRDVAGAVFRGGFDKLREAGVALLGGHTVQDPEIKFGYAVTGAIDPARILHNAGAQAGDRILLTKPIGTGVVGTAIKNGRAPPAVVEQAVEAMRTLNKAAAEVIVRIAGVHSCTDITGFGLIGHAAEVAHASGVTLVLEADRVPLLDGVRALVARNRSAGMKSNREHFGTGVFARDDIDADLLDLMYDPQTSGGLLIFVGETDAAMALGALRGAGVSAVEIGRALAPTGHWIELR